MNGLVHLINSLGVFRIAALAVVAAGFVAFFLYIITRVTTPDMALLYGDLTTEDSGQIIQRLESQNIPYQLGANGTQIYVPGTNVLRLRMTMAEAGLPHGGSVGYEIFDRAEGIGSSSFVQNINRLRALEGELGRSIKTISGVVQARVHLVLPQRRLFSRTQESPSASIVLQLAGNSSLNAGKVASIQYLVAAAVPGLKAGQISIVDGRGNLLARGGAGADGSLIAATSADERKRAYEHSLARSIEEMLEQTFGPGTVRAQVTAAMNFDRITTSKEVYDPDSQVARSSQTVSESRAAKEGKGGEKQVSISSQLPTPQPQAQGGEAKETSTSNNKRVEETVNYEISKTVESKVTQAGTVKQLSVAVLVDGKYGVPNAQGERAYTPRTKEEIVQVTALVKSAIGFNEKRGDKIEVANLQFAAVAPPKAGETGLLDGLTRRDYMRGAEIIVFLLVGALALLFVIRPMTRRLLEVVPALAAGNIQALESTEGMSQAHLEASEQAGKQGDDQGMIDIAGVDGRVKQSTLNKVSEIIENHPDESVSIVRGWMYNDG